MTLTDKFRKRPWLLNQEGLQYPAEIARGQHYDATSGGNGVGAPRALKVVAQAAPDNTVRILPGGGTAVSPWAENQSYYGLNHQPEVLEVNATGSASGGRTDLIVQRFSDPQYGAYPRGYTEADLTPETVDVIDFWWFEVLEGVDRSAQLDYPHVKLAELNRPANTTIVSSAHITDLRELANAQSKRIKVIRNIGTRMEVPRTGTGRLLQEFLVDVPDWATHAAIDAAIGGAYFRGVSGRGRMGIAAFNNSSHNEATPWWEEGGSTSGFRRIPYIQAGRKLYISPEYRGTVAQVLVQGVVDTWSDSGFIFGVDAGARAFLDIDWLQEAE